MSELQRILVQLDTDSQSSVFDAVVAIDAGVDKLLQYANVEVTNARSLVHGAMFTRGPKDLKSTALFVGGSNVALGEAVAAEIRQTFFGPIRCSVMLDCNGSNTTAAAAVLCAAKHVSLNGAECLVLGGTGPVGLRVARLLLGQNASVTVASRDASRAADAATQIASHAAVAGRGKLQSLGLSNSEATAAALRNVEVLISCGAAGVQLLDADALAGAAKLRTAIDLNAVPPAGIAGIEVMDKAVTRGSRTDYGAIGVGGLKMKIHREAVKTLFTRNDLYLDAEEIFEIGRTLV
ncbi:MAG: NAD(P)-dependent methylenetetrahydromethanopterin dehydrogenase [Pirellulales bacterium]